MEGVASEQGPVNRCTEYAESESYLGQVEGQLEEADSGKGGNQAVLEEHVEVLDSPATRSKVPGDLGISTVPVLAGRQNPSGVNCETTLPGQGVLASSHTKDESDTRTTRKRKIDAEPLETWKKV